MADLASTRVFGKLTVMHEAIIKANAEIVGNITASKFIGDGSQLTDLPWGQLTGAPATATRWPAWGEVTGKPSQATRWPSWSEVSSKPSTFTPSAHTHSLSQITGAGNLASLSTNASTSNFLRGDGTWVTPPNSNTTYSEITTAEIDAGTASTLRTITGRRMKHALDKKANTSIQVTAGTGLSGGGTLAANRTLSVNYGTAAGTAAQGNDSRLSNSREWTATTVSQSEAQAGTATTRRAWTAQRVRQAVISWWDSSTFKTKLDGIATGATKNATDAQLRARSSHTGTQPVSTITGLGTAATKNVGTGSGNVMEVGAFGLGGQSSLISDTEGSSFSNNGRNEFFYITSTTANKPSGMTYGQGISVSYGGNSYTSELVMGYRNQDGIYWRGGYSSPNDWLEIYHTGNFDPSTKANTSTQIIAGTGLSGGGTLAANRTLSVTYGTAAGTAAQGNDSRLSNSREWTASVVTQAEAQAGTAATARKWTAQRVAQAISALGLKIGTTATTAKAGNWMPTWANVTGKPTTFTPASHTHSLSEVTDAGNLASLNTNASTSNFLRGDGTWVTPPNTNTTYTEITTAEIDAGTASTLRTITGRRMKHALDKKANTTTQVIAGTGLSGGGTLAANRTLSVSYGTAAGTAAQGNDSRLSNSREWTASVVTKAEAEAGTATTARKWTAQRVKQAIDAHSSPALGVGQTWQDVSANRATDTIYTNSTGQPIMVNFGWGARVRNAQVRSSSSSAWVTVVLGSSGSANIAPMIVPNGAQYRLEGDVPNILFWTELR